MGEVDFLRSCVDYVYLTDVKSGNIGQVHKSGDKISAVFCLCKGYAWNFQHPEGSMAWLICFFFVVTKTFVSSCWFHFPSLHFLGTIFCGLLLAAADYLWVTLIVMYVAFGRAVLRKNHPKNCFFTYKGNNDVK